MGGARPRPHAGRVARAHLARAAARLRGAECARDHRLGLPIHRPQQPRPSARVTARGARGPGPVRCPHRRQPAGRTARALRRHRDMPAARPATASGVTFMTLEDETGLVNVVVLKRVFDKYAVLARNASLLGVSGALRATHAQPGGPRPGTVRVAAPALGVGLRRRCAAGTQAISAPVAASTPGPAARAGDAVIGAIAQHPSIRTVQRLRLSPATWNGAESSPAANRRCRCRATRPIPSAQMRIGH